MIIYLDFDGTVVEHQYPSIGIYNTGCTEVIKKLKLAGHEIILNTYRANCNDGTLEEAVAYLTLKNLFTYITSIQDEKIEPIAWNWEVHLEQQVIFIDDICEGIPTKPTDTAEYEIVDWQKVDEEFEENGMYKNIK